MADVKPISHEDKKTVNLAEKLTPSQRESIGKKIVEEYRTNLRSRRTWEEKRAKWFKLWLGDREKKNTPFPNASNVNLPLLAIACNQFHARTYQAMFSPPKYVKVLPVEKTDMAHARNVEEFMNWQTMFDMEEFEEEHDKLLLNVPISGTNFIKSYYSREKERPVSEYVSGVDVILPYSTRKLSSARHVVHRIPFHYEELAEKNRRPKFYMDFNSIPEAPTSPTEPMPVQDLRDKVETQPLQSDRLPHWILEDHCYFKMPWDDFPQPYIVTVHLGTEKLLRVTSRFVNDKSQRLDFWTDYHFILNPEGYYSLGFGHFLQDLNEMANTAFNQIFDSGRLTNQPFWFYGRQAGMKRKEMRLQPGLGQEVQDVSQIFFPNMQRVDQILFQVLGVIQQYSESFTSTSDYLLGREAKGVKTPTASGTLAIIEQGLVLYSVMIKRLFRSFKKELQLLYGLNQLSLPTEKQYRVIGDFEKVAFPKIKRDDFRGKLDVIPVGDPSFASQLARKNEAMERYQFLMTNPLVGANTLGVPVQNPKAIYHATRDVLETYASKDVDKFLPPLPEESIPPEMEHAKVMQGDRISPKPGENHITHLTLHRRFSQSKLFESLPKDKQEVLKDHMDLTRTMLVSEVQVQEQLAGQEQSSPDTIDSGGAPQQQTFSAGGQNGNGGV